MAPPATSQAPPLGADWRSSGVIIDSGPDEGRLGQNNGGISREDGQMLTRSGGDPDAARIADDDAGAAVDAADAAARVHNQPNNNSGGKKTKKRAVRRKRTYKKSKKSYKSKRSYKNKRSYKSKRSVKRGGETAPINFKIIKGNIYNQLFEVELQPDQTGKDYTIE